MQERILVGIPISIYKEEIFKFGYLKFLNSQKIESVKISKTQAGQKLSHFLDPRFLLKIELIKTRKNWIFTEVLDCQKIVEFATYKDFYNYSEILKLILKYCPEGEQNQIFSFLIHTLKTQNIQHINLHKFETQLLEKLGFVPQNHQNLDYFGRLKLGKQANQL